MKIGILGGSFNPPHLGHVRAAKKAVKQLGLDLLYIIPTATPPHKMLAAGASEGQRFEMAELAFGGLPKTEVSDMEILRGGKSYTVDTLHEMKARHPGAQMFLIMGGDMLLTIEQWRLFEELFSNAALVVFQRRDDLEEIQQEAERLKLKYGAEICVLAGDYLEISSTALRERMKKDENLEKLLSKEVIFYIVRNHLYQ